MKKLTIFVLCTLLLLPALPQIALANMAAPDDPDVGTTITFEKNEDIAVISEVLDITVNGAYADIVARYTMKNTTGDSISTPSMFLSPNIQNGELSVTAGGTAVDFTVDSYLLDYSPTIDIVDWQFLPIGEVVSPSENPSQTIDAVNFQLYFEADEQFDVVVSYVYRLGGYPDYDFDVKYGEIVYFLMPITMWKDFSSLTINLTLDDDLPVIDSSTLDFEQVGPNEYQYITGDLPDQNLHIILEQTAIQNFFGVLKNPYFSMIIGIFAVPIILIALIIFVIVKLRRRKAYKPKDN